MSGIRSFFKVLILFCLALFLAGGCVKDTLGPLTLKQLEEDEEQSDFRSFAILVNGKEYPATGAFKTDISVYVPAGTDLSNLVAVFKHNGSYVSANGIVQESGVSKNDFRDYKKGVKYRLVYDNGASRSYTVRVLDTRIPVLAVTTENGVKISNRETWRNATIVIRGTDGLLSNLGSAQIRGRGNWTWEKYKSEVKKYMEQLAGKTRETLKKGSNGEAVLKLQTDLDTLGYYSVRQNAAGKWYEAHLKKDGDFGTNTEEQVRLFQQYEGLKVTGIADIETLDRIEKRLEEMAGANTDEDYKAENLTWTMGVIIAEAKNEMWSYGNSHVYPPCADKTISCDRLISLALFRHGIRHQPHGGWAGGNLEKALLEMGWLKAEDPEKVTGNAVVVMYKDGGFCHAYWQLSYDPQTGLCSKYDAGDEWRWKDASQPFRGVKRNEWTDGREVGAVYTMPEPDKTMEIIRKGQQLSIDFTGHRIAVDGIFGTETKEQCIRVIQRAANIDYQAHLKEDGDRGPKTDAVMAGHYVEYGETQYMVTAVEIIAMLIGKDPDGVEMPGHYGDGLTKCLGTKKITYAQMVKLIGV